MRRVGDGHSEFCIMHNKPWFTQKEQCYKTLEEEGTIALFFILWEYLDKPKFKDQLGIKISIQPLQLTQNMFLIKSFNFFGSQFLHVK